MEVVDALILDDMRDTREIKAPLSELGFSVGAHNSLRQIGARFKMCRLDPEVKPAVVFVDLNWDDVPFSDFALMGYPHIKVPKNPFEFGITLIREIIRKHPVLRDVPVVCFSSVTAEPTEAIEELKQKHMQIGFVNRDAFLRGSAEGSELAKVLNELGVRDQSNNRKKLDVSVSLDSCYRTLSFVADVLGEDRSKLDSLVFGKSDSVENLKSQAEEVVVQRIKVLLDMTKYFMTLYKEESIPDRYSRIVFSGSKGAFGNIVASGDWDDFKDAVFKLKQELAQ